MYRIFTDVSFRRFYIRAVSKRNTFTVCTRRVISIIYNEHEHSVRSSNLLLESKTPGDGLTDHRVRVRSSSLWSRWLIVKTVLITGRGVLTVEGVMGFNPPGIDRVDGPILLLLSIN